MKKGTEWLKEEIGGLPCVGATFNGFGNGLSYIDLAVPVMDVYDLIDELDEPEEQKYYARIKGWELFADFVGVQYWGIVSIYGRLGFVSADDAKDKTKDEWKRLGVDDSNAEFVEVV